MKYGKYAYAKKTNKTATITVVVIAAAVLVVLGIFLATSGAIGNIFDGSGDSKTIEAKFQVEGLDPLAQVGKLPGASMEKSKKEEGVFSYRINSTPVFTDVDGMGNLLIQNPAGNQYLMVVEIVLQGSDEVIYRSQYIAPNQYIKEAPLSKVVPQGEHEAVAYITPVDPETFDLLDTFECPLTLTVNSEQGK